MINFFRRGGVCAGVGTWACILLAALLVLPLSLHAQQYAGTILGTVTDATGAAIPGATITVVSTDTGTKLTQKSGAQGEFTFAQLPVGNYEVHVASGNFKEYVETGVAVHTSTDTTITPILQVGSYSEKVTVQADAVQVQTTSAEVGEVVSGTQVRELPLSGENFVGLTQLSPGVSAAQGANFEGKGLQGGVNFSVNGNPYNYNLFLIDGVNNNDVGSGRTILVYPSVDTIAEFKMIRNSYGAEYGQAAGAIISITTKSGENQIHGGFFYAGRNDALDANDWLSNHNGTGKAEERRNDYGYNVSGPLWKDHAWVWWNQEWNKEISGINGSYATCTPTAAEEAGDFSAAQAGFNSSGTAIDQCGATMPTIPTAFQAAGNPYKIANPDAAGLLIAKFYPAGAATANSSGYNWATSIPNAVDWNEWNVRGDYQISRNIRATIRWTQDDWKNPVPNNPQGTFWGDSAFSTVMSNWSQPSKSVMGKVTETIGNTMVNDVEFGYGHNAIVTTLGGSEASIVPAIQAAYPSSFPSSIKTKDEFFGWGGLSDYAGNLSNSNFDMWNIAPYGNHENLYTIQDNFSKVWGDHTIKTGIFVSQNEKVENGGDGADRPSFPSYPTPTYNTGNVLADILIPGTGAAPQVFSGISEGSVDAIADVRWHDFEPYVADTWKINRKLTLSYGIRWSFFREPYGGDSGGNTDPVNGNASNYAHQWSNWDPSAWSAAEATANPTDACNGLLVVPGTNPCATQKAFLNSLGANLPFSNGTQGPNNALVQQDNHAIAPRVGIAYDLHGDGKTAIRLGGGQFNQREPVGLAEQLAFNAPFKLTANSNRSFDTPAALTAGSISPTATKSTGGHLPASWQWNATLEQEIARNNTFEISYVGNTGIHLTSMYDANEVPLSNLLQSAFTTGNSQCALRPAFNFCEIGAFGRAGHANYNSLQALFRSQEGPSTFQAAYTWGHSMGNVDLDNSSGSITAQATTDLSYPHLDHGNTNINRPNIFVANEVLFLPKLANHGLLVQNTIGGWESSSIVSLAQGSSFTVFTSGISGGCTLYDANGTCDPAGTSTLTSLTGTGYNNNNRPLITNTPCDSRSGNQIINPNHFTVVGYTIGSFPSNMEHRGDCYGAPNTNVDAQLAKNWYIKEKYRIKFSMDFFNLFNHANFNSGNLEGTNYSATAYCGGATAVATNPATGLPYTQPTGQPCGPTNNVITSVSGASSVASQFGQATGVNNPRELQYTLRFSF